MIDWTSNEQGTTSSGREGSTARGYSTKRGENKASDAPHGRITGASADGKTIGLCMIVKDEAHVILRCLESVHGQPSAT
jgi:hypothetical protein